MNAEVFRLTPEQMKDLISKESGVSLIDKEWEMLMQSARLSQPLLGGFYAGNLLMVMGFIPRTLLSDRAMLWAYDLPKAKDHKLVVARTSRSVVQNMLDDYPTIYGVCVGRGMQWVQWLGGEFGQPFNGAVPFEIRRA